MIDLDLDVARTWSGQVEILDQDEFELHQKTLQYPRDIIARAESTADLVANLVRKGRSHSGLWERHGERMLLRYPGQNLSCCQAGRSPR